MPFADHDRPRPGDLAAAFGLLTRLPLPAAAHTPRGAAAAWAWPVAGAVVGAIGAAAAWVCLGLGLTAGVAAAAALAAQAMATGALHEDGLADTADGLFGGWTPARRLEIMKDSHIGSFGTLALLLVTLARWSALTALCATGGAAGATAALVAAGALSRAPMAVLMALMPPARSGGLSRAVGRPSRRTAALGLLVACAIALPLVGWALPGMVLLVAVLCGTVALLAQARIGGQTGDILGAAQQLGDTAVLALAAARI
jgi:adenosylcobinamide-GDP ribazoletransferase